MKQDRLHNAASIILLDHESMIATVDFSKASVTDIVVACIFFGWAFISLFFWCEGFGKEPRASSALQIILKYAPHWWRTVTWSVFGLVFIALLLSLIFKI